MLDALAQTSPTAWGQSTWLIFGGSVIVAVVSAMIAGDRIGKSVREGWLRNSLAQLFADDLVIGALTERHVDKRILEHSRAPDAHANLREAAMERHRRELRDHDESPTAHHVALSNFPDRRELQGAIERIENKVDSRGDLMLAELRNLRNELKLGKRGDDE